MRRILIGLAVFALAPLTMGAGGAQPPSSATRIVNPALRANITLDPHMAAGDPGAEGPLPANITTTAKQGTIRLTRGSTGRASALFKIPPSFFLYRGCDLLLTDTRFLSTADQNNKLSDFIPPEIITQLLKSVGAVPPANSSPVITDIERADCTPDPHNPGPIPDGGDGFGSEPGILSMDVTIRFRVPR